MRVHLHKLAAFRCSDLGRREGTHNWSRRLLSDAASVSPAAAIAPSTEPQPLTDLLGRRHDYLRISLTERCNLRCQYCMPAAGVPLSPRAALLSRSELARLVRTFAKLGVRKVRLTGGEPTLRRDLEDIIEDISSVSGISTVAITTNGLVLTRRLLGLQRAGLSALNVSLDSLKKERYETMARRPGLPKVLAGIDLALQLGYSPVKVNTVLMKGFNDDEISDFVEYTRDREIEVRFIEFMPFSGNEWDDSKLVPHRAAVRALLRTHPDAVPRTPEPNHTAQVWKVPGYAGSVGFISSMTKNFCSTCNRLRITADGNLKVCLFGASEVSLRDALRSGASDADVESLIRTALNNKKPQHAESRTHGEPPDDIDRGLAATTSANVTALRIGGPCSAKRSPPLEWQLTKPKRLTNNPVTLDKKLLNIVTLTSQLMSQKSLQTRLYSSDSGLTHLDSKGKAKMVDIGEKDVTNRTAVAECFLKVDGKLLQILRDANLPKGDALTVAQIAGVVGAKKTSDLIPLCHPLPIDCVSVKIDLPKGECIDGGDIKITCEVKVTSRTGAEMEALTGAAIASLTLYDMCKAVDKGMKVMNLRVVKKIGGKSGDWPKRGDIHVKSYDNSAIQHAPPYFI